MKNIRYLLMAIVALAIFSRCDQGIDPITAVDPGPDGSAPTVTMKYPLDGTKIKVNDKVASINIEFEATDDIEVADIKVAIDGNQIANMNDFKDYRRVLANIPFDGVTTGTHELKVTATDTDGKSTSSIVNFEKEPPYIPLFENEIFYMAFDSDYTELISVTPATKVGDPAFAGEGVNSDNAYAGAADSYLTFPTAGMNLGNELSAIFWYKLNPVPDRAGILAIGPKDDANPDAQNNRTSGFRLLRENAGGNQRIKLNVGDGSIDTWVDGGTAADLNPASTEWINIAFTISGSKAILYFNGELVKESDFTGISWAGCDILSIMSGAPRFTGWDHKSDLSYMDELRFFDKALSQAEIQNIIGVTNPYTPADGETLFMNFDEDYSNMVTGANATQVGTPGFAGEAKQGTNAYAGATDSYLTFPSTGLTGESFSATMWYKLNATPERGGILVMGPPDPDHPDAMNIRTSGFRFFREPGADGNQRFKLNVGNGTGETWVDGGTAADVDPTTGNWIYLAFTMSGTEAKVYINGEEVAQNTYQGIDWTGCDLLSIMSGAPRFTEWGHKSDLSYLDDLHLYNKVLTQEEIQSMMAD